MTFAMVEYRRRQWEYRRKIIMKAVLDTSPVALRIIDQEEEAAKQLLKKPRKKRSCQTRPWLQRRALYGQYENLLQELKREDIKGFKIFQRLTPEVWNKLYELVAPLIERRVTSMRDPISAGLRLAITLRYLASGDNYQSSMFGFRVTANTICGIIPDTCHAICEVLREKYFTCPTTPEEWRQVAKGFWEKLNFPLCIGALDGKHVAIKKPARSGSDYFNYKGFTSIVMMALVDSDYKFMWVDVGSKGRFVYFVIIFHVKNIWSFS